MRYCGEVTVNKKAPLQSEEEPVKAEVATRAGQTTTDQAFPEQKKPVGEA